MEDDDPRLDQLSSVDVQNFHYCPQLRSTALPKHNPETNGGSTGQEPDDNNDFLAVLTCATLLYSQGGVLKMRAANSVAGGAQAVYGQGALGQVTRVDADFAQPSNQRADEVETMLIKCAAKRYRGHQREGCVGSLIGGSRSTSLWDEHGNARNSVEARSFVMELRVLSHPSIRNSENIVKIQGLEWDGCETIPKPIIILEGASWNLSEFLKEFQSLPSRTKWQLAQDIASGLDTLHNCGVIHGDVKPDNVLIFKMGRNYKAKLADFSHSLLDNKAFRSLIGGTEAYAAPEWKEARMTDQLKLTDVYSYGLTFACLMMGTDPFAKARHDGREAELRRHKYQDSMISYLHQEMASLDDPNMDDHDKLWQILSLTLQQDPGKRDLKQVKSILLSKGSLLGDIEVDAETVMDRMKSRESLSIPYQALAEMPGSLHGHVVRVLTHVANKEDGDYRAAAAAFELAVCYSSGFGIPPEVEINDKEAEANAMAWLLRAAQASDQRARLSLVPVYEAFGGQLPPEVPIHAWLEDLVKEGCTLALDPLRRLSPSSHEQILRYHRQTYCGRRHLVLSEDFTVDVTGDAPERLRGWLNDNHDTVLHYVASKGSLDLLDGLKDRGVIDSELLNKTNRDGDTPLLQAVRAGHADMARALLLLGAQAGIANNLNETVLHFLVNLDDKDIEDIADKLAKAGARPLLQKIADGSSSGGFDGFDIMDSNSAALRAVSKDNAAALRALFHMEDSSPSTGQFGPTAKATVWRLLAFALRFHQTRVLDVLAERLESNMGSVINSRKFWFDNNLTTLLEACVFGPVSSNEAFGFDYPERFTRILRFGVHYRPALASCLHFLVRHGAAVKGIHRFAIENRRRDAISELTLAIYSNSRLSWARLAIDPPRHAIFHDLLSMHSRAAQGAPSWAAGVRFPLLYLSQILAGGIDPALLQIFTKWLRQTCNSRSTHWVPQNPTEEAQLQRCAGSTTSMQFHPLYSAYRRKRPDIMSILFEFGASLQDRTTNGITTLGTILRLSPTKPQRIAALLQIAVDSRSECIIRIEDLATILLADCCSPDLKGMQAVRCPIERDIGMLSVPDRLADRTAWVWSEPASDFLLEWNNMHEVAATAELWGQIEAASRCQKQPIQGSEPGLRYNLVLHAALESNLAAVRCLLGMGFHPDGTGEPCPSWLGTVITPLDVVRWTSYVPDKRCSPTGLTLKRTNQAIAALLLERGGRHGQAYSRVYHFFGLSFLDMKGSLWFMTWFLTLIPGVTVSTMLGTCGEYNISCTHEDFVFLVIMNCLWGLYTMFVVWKCLPRIFMGARRSDLVLLAFGGDPKILAAALFWNNNGIFGRFLAARLGKTSDPAEFGNDLEERAPLLDGVNSEDAGRDRERRVAGPESAEGRQEEGHGAWGENEPSDMGATSSADVRHSGGGNESWHDQFLVEGEEDDAEASARDGRHRRVSRNGQEQWAERGRKLGLLIGRLTVKRVIPVAVWPLRAMFEVADRISDWKTRLMERQRQGRLRI
ncbi:hypothetical protein QBC33DRAFT_542624 [Phialemonium atrogriseum]|uniref:Protein kinase domain-containing protein n=1 Tax=Phialemonium atrogriseum TaxID=1093897 RepID=A0AAJ0BZB6_9PEZI|nr:uncharacterized protein QBC33DRAFT_542624 [Phialemonium atrogriseum]KAK1765832.1 hypothetical protein QBC33DRAFT_542624 [Phialemonium atrogriseum]